MDLFRLSCFFLSIVNVAWGNAPPFLSDERKLYHSLIDPLERSVRPVRKAADTVQLSFGMNLIRFDDLDEKAQKLTSNVWLSMSWRDPQLAWDPKNHSGINDIKVPAEKIWLPDITLYNSAHGNADPRPIYPWMQAVVYADGTVLFIPHYQLESSCMLDMSRFPYDQHECQLKFGSWTHHQGQVNISHYGGAAQVDDSNFNEHAEWDLVDHKAVLNAKKYDCCPETYQDITYTLTLKRRSSYYNHVFVSPAVILCFLTPTLFWLPPEGSEKMSLGAGILLGHIFLMVMLENYIPSAHPVVPMLGVYYMFGLVMISLALVLSVMIRNIWSQGNRRKTLPHCVRTVILGLLGRLLCVRREPYMPVQELNAMEEEMDDRAASTKVANLNAKSEWRQLAVTLDRLFFITFFVINLIVSIAILV